MNETTPKISVIVPVYKAEAYLHRCVDSILAQTFQNFEILLVDDGSPDRSGEICDEYARKDKRVRVFHKENGGVSSARQCGMDHAQGEYTIHADPDDWVDPTMLEELYKKAKEEDADVVICDYFVEERKGTKYIPQKPSALDHKTVLCELFQQLHGSCCNKLVLRACYSKYNIKFPLDLSFCEDLLVNVQLTLNPIRICYLPKAFYHYDQQMNTASLTHCLPVHLLNQEKRLYEKLSHILQHDLWKEIYPYLLWRQARLVLICGKPYTQNFARDFHNLKYYITCINIPFLYKFYLKLAFFTPSVIPIFHRIWIGTHR